MSDPTQWMKRFANSESNYPSDRTVWQWGGLTAVTDRHCLLCVTGTDGESLENVTDKWASSLLHWMGTSRSLGTVLTTLGDLWAWLDRIERIICPQCQGVGLVGERYTGPILPGDQTRMCPSCDMQKWVFPAYEDDRDTVSIEGVAIDRNRLAWWLAPELGELDSPLAIQAKLASKPIGIDVIFLFGETWKLIIAGIQASGTGRIEGKSYRTYTPGAGAWWETRRQASPAIHPGTDWFIDQGYDSSDLVKMWGAA